ncbi:hypothetical protein HRbin39_00027 [bacterium HR39]|nr:hypothetical protein HRbin39_00027 [bacterium HR39]
MRKGLSLLALGLVLAPGALAQDPPAEIVEAVAAARSEVLLAAPRLTHEALAKALHEAVVKRGVRAYLLLPPKEAEAKDAYTSVLSLVGASIRLARVNGYGAMVDGRLVYPQGNPDLWRGRFVAAFARAPSYRYQPKPSRAKVLPYNPFTQLGEFVKRTLQEEARLRSELRRLGLAP